MIKESKSINGYQSPQFIIYNNYPDEILETIDLPRCGSAGLVEEYEFVYIQHNMLDYSTSSKFAGFYINFSLDYNEYANSDTSLKIKKLVNYILDDSIIYLVPRIDIPYRNYQVIFTGDAIQLGIMKGAKNAKGNKLLNLKFRTKNLQTNIDWSLATNQILIAIDDFATISI